MTTPHCDRPGHARLAPRLHVEVHMQMGPTGAAEMGALIDALLTQHAHELADQQRAFADQEDGQLTSLCAGIYVRGIRDGADHIDPKEQA